MQLASILNLIVIVATTLLVLASLSYIVMFSRELITTMTRKNLETNLFFLGANIALLALLAVVIKQMVGGL